jgi:hypothetical protein
MTKGHPMDSEGHGLRRAVGLVALLNLAYFAVEFAVAVGIGSVSLFADSIDFLEDTSVNFLILVALGWSLARRARVGMALAGMLLIPGVATLWTAWDKFMTPVAHRPGRAGGKPELRVPAGALPTSPREPDTGGLSVGAERRLRQCGDHRGRISHGLAVGVGLTRSNRWPRDCRHERRRRARGLARGPRRTPNGVRLALFIGRL